MTKKTKEDDAATGYAKLTAQMQGTIYDLQSSLSQANLATAREKEQRELADAYRRQADKDRDEANARLIARCERSKMTDVELQVLTQLALSALPGQRVHMGYMGPIYESRNDDSAVDRDLRRRAMESLEIELVARGLIAPRQKVP